MAGDGDCAFRTIVVVMLEQAYWGSRHILKSMLSTLALAYMCMPESHRTPDVQLGYEIFQVNV